MSIHTLSTSAMLNITILANNMIYGNLYHVNIFQNTHLAAYDETHMHAPNKVLIQLGINVKLGVNVDKEIGIHNIKGQKAKKHHKDIHYKDYEIHILVLVHKQKNKTPTKI